MSHTAHHSWFSHGSHLSSIGAIQIELPEKREAIRTLEVWLDAQTFLLQTPEPPPISRAGEYGIKLTDLRTEPVTGLS